TCAIKLRAVRVFPKDGDINDPIRSANAIDVELEFTAEVVDSDLCVGFQLLNGDGHCILQSYQTDMPAQQWPTISPGSNTLRCTIPAGLLNAGSYSVAPKLSYHRRTWILNGDPIVTFEVTLSHGVSPLWTNVSDGTRPGILAPILDWQCINPARCDGAHPIGLRIGQDVPVPQ